MTRYSPVLKTLPSALSLRLHEAMALRQFTVDQLSFAADVGKGLLTRLITDEPDRLPDTYTLIKLAHALDVSLEYLLGLGAGRADAQISFAADFFDDASGSGNAVCDDVFLAQAGGYFVYICETIPDFLKTRAVLDLELGDKAAAAALHARALAMREATEARENCGIMILDCGTIDHLAGGTGPYAGLTAAQAREQLGAISEFLDGQHPIISATVVDFHKHGLTQMYLSTPCRVVSRLGDGYLSVGNGELYRRLRAKARAACRAGVSLHEHLRNTRSLPRPSVVQMQF